LEDLDMPNPKERAKRLLLFLQQDFAGYAKAAGIEMPQPSQMSTKTPDESKEQAIADLQRLQAGEDVQPEFVDESYIKVFIEFVQSPQFQELDDAIRQKFVDFVGKLKQLLESQMAAPGASPAVPAGNPATSVASPAAVPPGQPQLPA
jgi:hypothetical protein